MGRYLSVLGLAVGATGCAQLAGIEDTSGPPPPDEVSLAFQRASIGATVVTAPQDLTGYTATYLVPDAAAPEGLTRVFAQLSATNTWSAPIETGSPPVLFSLPDYPRPIPRIYAFDARNVDGIYGVFEHPHPVAADPAAMLTVQATLDAPYNGEGLQLYTVGTWTVRGFAGAELPATGATTLGPVTIPYASSSSITGRPLEKITVDDQPLLLRYIANDLTGSALVPPFDQTGTDTLAATMMPNAHDQQVVATLTPGAIAARYTPARPALANLAMSWSLNASPGHTLAQNTGPTLQAAGVAPTDPDTVTVAYGNPFTARGWDTTMTWSTSENRTFTPAAQMLPVTLTGAMYQVIEPTATETLALPAGLPEAITLDTKPLSTDGLTMTKPATALTATFVVGTPCTLYQLQLFDLVPNAAATALEYRYVVSASGQAPSFVLPPEMFEAMHSYTLRAICIAGSYPNIATGDLSRSLPVAVGYFDSGVFTVMP